MQFSKDEPLFGINIAAQKINASRGRLRIYEQEKLVAPARTNSSKNGQRMYSQNEIEWLIDIRILLNQYNMNIEALKVFLKLLYTLRHNKLTLDKKDLSDFAMFNRLLNNPVLEEIVPSL